MCKLKILIFVLTLCQVSQTFDAKRWLQKYCVSEPNLLYFGVEATDTDNMLCKGASFSKKELNDIQESNFVISNKKTIVFDGGNLGILNDCFFDKFPKSENFFFYSTKIEFGISRKSNIVKYMKFENSDITINDDSEMLQNLPNLENLVFIICKFDSYTRTEMNSNFLGNIPNVRNVSIQQSNFESLAIDAFEGSPNIEILSFEDNKFKEFPKKMFSEFENLKELHIIKHGLQSVPCEILPENIEILDLKENRIERPNFKGCTFTKSLKDLDLKSNNIQILDINTFDLLENIEKIDLGDNKLKSFSNEYIKVLYHLKWIGLYGNRIPIKHLNALNIPYGTKF